MKEKFQFQCRASHALQLVHTMFRMQTRLIKSHDTLLNKMNLLQRPAGDDGSWTMIDFDETVVRRPGPLYICIIPSYREFNPYDRSNSPYSIVFQPKLARALFL